MILFVPNVNNINERLTNNLILGGHWISISLWDMEEIYVMGDKVWYRYPKADLPPASWVFMCFEFDLANGTLTFWKNGREPYFFSKIPELGNLTRKPDSLRKHVVLGKIQERSSNAYKCNELVLYFGNMHVYDNYPMENISCSSNGNYLGKAYKRDVYYIITIKRILPYF